MNTLMVGYDLNKKGKNYEDLHAAIKQCPLWWHHLDSTWIVKTAESPVQLRDRLKVWLDSDDELLVAKISPPAAWVGFNEKGSSWLTNNL